MRQEGMPGLSRRGYLAAQAAMLAGLAAPAGALFAAEEKSAQDKPRTQDEKASGGKPANATAPGDKPANVHAPGDKPSRQLRIGVATLGFADRTNAALAKELSAAGIRLIQLFLAQTDSKFWKYNGYSDVSSLTPARCREIAAPYRGAGIEIHSIAVYTNLIHPDEAERKAALDYFAAMMDIGGHMGVRAFITEAGHYQDPKAPAPPIALEFQDAVWPRMIATARQLAALAGQRDAKVLFEPFYRGFLASAKRLRLAAGSPPAPPGSDLDSITSRNVAVTADSRITQSFDLLHIARRQVVLPGYDALSGLLFQLKAGALGDGAAGLGGILVFVHAGSVMSFGDLTCG